ncbi:ribonucleoside-diphosphate reductase, adenosylcobalamin-dependent [Thermobaculum terrenum ATCC BAA-798]|uniref:Vitamin B12-dependent ribonucleotide reductase n=1 Tax=Thermobaculum terrenum (strain ATCC BAA-798 / CCMEE 7001 / YNP1) TaxID=525904 RepID=D1CHT8_THET1|nr:adenosylcobalamin-dependent ribonucleoside-diphosphate reductase [Thermobaculum terrenum]ACZ43309.1 ribonucleoside-diphosphate reductase, adenosylcobalamin-dependent [Thermobaculum terrenum ATCC BAA-798]
MEEPKLSTNALIVLEERYLRRNAKLEIIETPAEMFWRVARAVADADALYGPRSQVAATAERFYQAMAHLEFLPNSPTLMNAGTPSSQCMACFVLPVEDSLEGIFDTLKLAALIQQTGGGTGFSFSRLRPRGDVVHSTGGISSGAVSFMMLYNAMTETIKQGSKRRGANMGILRVDHPDVREFVTSKRDRRALNNFNISVGVTDEFMRAIEKGEKYPLVNPRDRSVWEHEDARRIWELIIQEAWDSGEPGLVALDTINRQNPTKHLGEIEATNPCAEEPLHPYEACCLGSINLNAVVTGPPEQRQLDWHKLGELVDLGVHFLDNVIDINHYPDPRIEDICRRNRRIGLGVMGWADLLFQLGVPYDSEEALSLAEELMGFVEDRAVEASVKLAERRGVFPNYPGSDYDRRGGPRMRNATTRTIAPTGTIGIIANCSAGIEPLFALTYTRRALGGRELKQEIHPVFLEEARRRGVLDDHLREHVVATGRVRNLPTLPEDLRRVFATALEISPEWHVRMQATFQRHVDNGVSKTINLPQEATPEDVESAYRLAYELGCKGITVYRYGSRPEQVLSLEGYCLTCAREDGLPTEEPVVELPLHS